MKKLLSLCFLMLVCCEMTAQNRLFVRVFDLDGNKTHKGYILGVNDTLLRLKKDTTYIDIPVKTIGTIKTKRSAGNNVLIGTLAGATVMGVLVASTAEPGSWFFDYSPAEGALIGIFIGAPIGALLGVTTVPFKNPKKFTIDGDAEKWKAFITHFSEKTSDDKK